MGILSRKTGRRWQARQGETWKEYVQSARVYTTHRFQMYRKNRPTGVELNVVAALEDTRIRFTDLRGKCVTKVSSSAYFIEIPDDSMLTIAYHKGQFCMKSWGRVLDDFYA